MTPRALARLLGAYLVVVAALCGWARSLVTLRAPAEDVTIASVWRAGKLEARTVLPREPEPAGEHVVLEIVTGTSRLLTSPDLAFALSLVPGKDGVSATVAGRTVYVTPDDLLATQAYDHGMSLADLSLSVGVRTDIVLALLSERLGTRIDDIKKNGEIRRIRVARSVKDAPPPANTLVTPDHLTRDIVRDAAFAAARYLARGLTFDGHFRYTVDAHTNADLPGYEWARHSGATYFLAQAAAASKEPELAFAAIRAASLLRDHALVSCGDFRCIGSDDNFAEIGSTSLALVAFAELSKNGTTQEFAPLVPELARFLRAQQRPDGELMHLYDRGARHPVDVQLLYFSGEAALALTRAHDITHDPADLDASKRALAHLVGPAWRFFGDRYYFGEEHWTCQVVDELWAKGAPNPEALDFCVRWHAYSRHMQFIAGETPFDADGAFGVAPFVTPRLTPVASRCEAAVATRHALALAHGSAEDLAALDAQLRRSLALLVRQQLRPGAAHLFADPDAVAGAIPGSEVDWQLRIDYAQHAGSAMIRWVADTQ
jgi:hypothetical protein